MNHAIWVAKFGGISKRLMRRKWFNKNAVAVVVFCVGVLGSTNSRAADYGVVLDGLWSDPATWTPGGGPPTATDNAYVGVVYPPPAISPATVTLDAAQTVSTVSIGNALLGTHLRLAPSS